MRIFPHGNVVNFQESAREMTAVELEKLLNQVLIRGRVLTGSVDLQQSELVIYGQALSIELNEETDCVTLRTVADDGVEETHTHAFSDLLISHEVHFDIEEPEGRTVRYSVYYLTFNGETIAPALEQTWFFADAEAVTRPLDCVVEFWRQASQTGRDADFSSGGCSIPPDFKRRVGKNH
jgi:hypothetical protein